VVAAVAEPGCIVCIPAAAAARQYLRGVLGDGVNDVELRAQWRQRGGLCRHHWQVWRWLDAPALSSSVLLRDLLPSVWAARSPAGGAASVDASAPWWRTLVERQPVLANATVDCPACELEQVAEQRYLSALARLDPERLSAALAVGPGFACLRHLAELPPGTPAGGVREQLEERLQSIVDDLETFLRRSDHRFAHEPMGQAGDAWLRAIRALGGDV